MHKIILLLALFLMQSAFAIESPEAFLGITASEEDYKAEARDIEHKTSGVYYENNTKRLFKKMNYKFKTGSLRNNITALIHGSGYKLHWNLDTDYDVPAEFTIRNKNVPEIVAEATSHLPVKTMFYTKNRMVTMMPMYDKKESDYSNEYTVDTRR